MAALIPFAKTPLTDEFQASVRWEWTPDRHLVVRYRLSGPLGRLQLPDEFGREAGFSEGLWETTCFELFVALPGQDSYWEWNFAPSGKWALFEFVAPRTRSLQQPRDLGPRTSFRREGADLVVEAELSEWPGETLGWAAMTRAPIEATATLVLEHAKGEKSYWAVAHRGERPDFHDRRSFVLRL